ncbi:hypothetical protein [Streptomyces sp. AP-93]|uniref:hypothetical protein n=1 Tax=Streptomyces sp. AP-93 TaxID=2929048 RepID=UPI001FAFE1CE|nr:hypothetical protein [Streptomyces sp. AP-93]MCJ0871921.1 hypothetical protein [Streptomyces sp. AP-93]
MIVSTAVGDVNVLAGSVPARWQSLIRRGMLFSECEGVEFWDLPEGATLPVRAEDGAEEAVLVLRGAVVFRAQGQPAVSAGAGRLLLLPHGLAGALHAEGPGTALVVVRGLPAVVSRRLPERLPELPAAHALGEQ